MKFFREKNDEIYRAASMQARIFERSSIEGLNSYDFIMAFMFSEEAFQLDAISFDNAGLSEREIYASIKNKIANISKKTTVYSPEIMHWIGFFYRYASYLMVIPSKSLFKKIGPKYLSGIYPTYHSLEISKAVNLVLEEKEELFISPQERFVSIFASPDSKDEYFNIQEISKKK